MHANAKQCILRDHTLVQSIYIDAGQARIYKNIRTEQASQRLAKLGARRPVEYPNRSQGSLGPAPSSSRSVSNDSGGLTRILTEPTCATVRQNLECT